MTLTKRWATSAAFAGRWRAARSFVATARRRWPRPEFWRLWQQRRRRCGCPIRPATCPLYLAIWISTAVVSAALIGVQMFARTRRIHSGHGRRDDPHGGGAVSAVGGRGCAGHAGAGALCARGRVDAAGIVAGHFQSGRVFILPVSAAAHAGGGCVVPADGAVLHLAGRRARVFAMGDGSFLRGGTTAGGGHSALRSRGRPSDEG